MKEYLDFFATVPPYDALTPSERDRLVHDLEVEYAPRGHVLTAQGTAPAGHTWVVRSGSLEVLDGEHVVDVLTTGDTVDGPGAVVAAEDSLLYRIPLRLRPPPAPHAPAPAAARWARAAVVVRPDDTVAETSRRITDERTSCVVVAFPDGLGVVTDADIRRRVGTGEVPPAAPVAGIASRPALTVGHEASVNAALLTMVEHGVHHLVVVDTGGTPTGVLRAVDLTSAEVRDPLALRAAVDAAPDLEALAQVVAGLAGAVVELHDAGLPPLRVSALLAAVLEGVVRRVLRLGGHLDGEAASLLALGSLARREVLPSSDIDTALVWEHPSRDLRPAAARLLDDLERVGLHRCPQGANADDPRYGRSLADWRSATSAWARDPSRDAGLLLMTMLAGSRALTAPELAAEAVAGLAGLRDTVAFRKTVLDYTLAARPPLGFVRGVVIEHDGEHRGRLDLKAGGLRPVTAIARWTAILGPDGGARGLTTIEQLRHGVATGMLTGDEGESLVRAYEHLFGLALHAEVTALRHGEPPSTWIDPSTLDGLGRRLLREAFRTVARVQGHLQSDWAPRWR